MSLEHTIDTLLSTLFGNDILHESDTTALTEHLLRVQFGREQLQAVHDFVARQSVTVDGQTIPAVLELPATEPSHEVMGLIAQLHGNEPAGLAAIAFAMALWRKQLLNATVYCIIGTPLAARQYFEAWQRDPLAIQESRDGFRRGYDTSGQLLRDPNRIPADFRDHPEGPHNARAIALEALADRFTVTLDIHSARGDLICVTEYTELKHLLYSPIRNVLAELASNIGSHASACTFKTLLLKKPHIRALTGIEAGRHEDPASPTRAIAFTHALMFNLGLTTVAPAATYRQSETHAFALFQVGSTLNFSQLQKMVKAPGKNDDRYYTVKPSNYEQAKTAEAPEVIVRHADCSLELRQLAEVSEQEESRVAYRLHQFAELEEVYEGDVVAVAIPSGIELKAPTDFYALFVAKSAALYNDKAAGVLPIATSALEQKFCYPCSKRVVRVE